MQTTSSSESQEAGTTSLTLDFLGEVEEIKEATETSS